MKFFNRLRRKKDIYLDWDSLMIMNNERANVLHHRRNLIRAGFKFINRTNKYKKLIAYGLIIIGCITAPFPCGSIVLIGLGVGMLGLKKDFVKRWYGKLIYIRKAKRGNRIK